MSRPVREVLFGDVFGDEGFDKILRRSDPSCRDIHRSHDECRLPPPQAGSAITGAARPQCATAFVHRHALGEISAPRTFQKVVEAAYAIPSVPIGLEHNMMLSPLIRVAVVFG